MSALELTSKVQELRELRRMAEELAGEIDTLQDQIKAYMDALGVSELHGADFKITWHEVKSSRFDSKAFKAAHGDLYGLYARETVSRRFCLA